MTNTRFIIAIILLITISSCTLKKERDKYIILWIDATANLENLNSRDKVKDILLKTKEAGIDAVAVGIKPLSGHVLYPSEFAPRLTEWKGKHVDTNFDLFTIVREEGLNLGIDVHLLMMAFSEGHKLFKTGPIYDRHPEWQTLCYDIESDETEPRLIPITELRHGLLTPSIWAGFTNPVNPEVRKYELSVLKEVLEYYHPDKIVFDRIRFNGLNSDFTDLTKKAFEEFIGTTLNRWPEDVFELKRSSDKAEVIKGCYYEDWLFFRAKVIHDFFQEAVKIIREFDSKIVIGDYVGSWYPTYYTYGVNWGSIKHFPPFPWARADYNKTAYAEMLDWITVGCYFPDLTKSETKQAGIPFWESIEGGMEVANEAINGAIPLYGAVYAENFAGQPERFKTAMQIILEKGQGMKIFDLSQIIAYDWWDEIDEVLSKYKTKGKY